MGVTLPHFVSRGVCGAGMWAAAGVNAYLLALSDMLANCCCDEGGEEGGM